MGNPTALCLKMGSVVERGGRETLTTIYAKAVLLNWIPFCLVLPRPSSVERSGLGAHAIISLAQELLLSAVAGSVWLRAPSYSPDWDGEGGGVVNRVSSN